MNLYNYIDSHAHLSEESVLPNIESIIQRAREKGIRKIINICTDQNSLEQGLLLAEKYPEICNTGSTTPHDVDQDGEQMFPFFSLKAREGRLVAIGETGLDYHYQHSSVSKQKEFLLKYFSLALECRLPIVFHCREAFDDLFKMADEHYRVGEGWGPAVLHCFTGSKEEADEVIRRGWYISFSGILTFKKSEALRAVAREMPLDRILIETDTPYLAPQAFRGQPNEPSYLPETAGCLAAVMGISIEDIARATVENTERLFGARVRIRLL